MLEPEVRKAYEWRKAASAAWIAERCRLWAGRRSPRPKGGSMADVMKGIRVLEVAEHTFVPAASAVLADWART